MSFGSENDSAFVCPSSSAESKCLGQRPPLYISGATPPDSFRPISWSVGTGISVTCSIASALNFGVSSCKWFWLVWPFPVEPPWFLQCPCASTHAPAVKRAKAVCPCYYWTSPRLNFWTPWTGCIVNWRSSSTFQNRAKVSGNTGLSLYKLKVITIQRRVLERHGVHNHLKENTGGWEQVLVLGIERLVLKHLR